MVNDVKQQILSSVRNSDKPVSGETLSGDLGISRVAVWKHISSLKEKGYDISSSRAGYMLKGEKDFLYPWEFPGHDITYIENTESTMDLARKMKEAHPPNRGLKIIVAGKQNGGRGRLGRKWISREGGLYFTLMTSSSLPPSFAPLESLKTGALIASLLRETYSIPAQVKWPNDVLVEDRKIAGVLIETTGDLSFVGIGLNLASAPLDTATYVARYTKSIDRDEWAQEIIRELIVLSEAACDLEAYRAACLTLGQRVRLEGVGTAAPIEGTASDVDDHGRLVVMTAAGERRVSSGECLHLRTSKESS